MPRARQSDPRQLELFPPAWTGRGRAEVVGDIVAAMGTILSGGVQDEFVGFVVPQSVYDALRGHPEVQRQCRPMLEMPTETEAGLRREPR